MNDVLEHLDRLLEEGRHGEIESVIRARLEITPADDPFRVMLLNELGNYCKGISRLEDAEKAYQTVIALLMQASRSRSTTWPGFTGCAKHPAKRSNCMTTLVSFSPNTIWLTAMLMLLVVS